MYFCSLAREYCVYFNTVIVPFPQSAVIKLTVCLTIEKIYGLHPQLTKMDF